MSSPPDSEAAAHRRWLITIMITVVFGAFGAVMAYLSYMKSSAPSRSRTTVPIKAPATQPTVIPPAAEPTDSELPGKSDKDKPDKAK